MKEAIVYINESGEIANKNAVKEFFKLKPGRYKITANNCDKRTLPQNAYFHSILPELQKGLYDAGWRNITNVNRAKRMIKELFLTEIEKNEVTGEEMKVVRDTHDLNKEEMSNFLDEVLQWAAEYLSVTIYSPNEQSKFQY